MKVVLEGRGIQRHAEQLGELRWWQDLARRADAPPVESVRVLRSTPGACGLDCDVELTLADPYQGRAGQLGWVWLVGGLASLLIISTGAAWGIKDAIGGMGTGLRALLFIGAAAWGGKQLLGDPTAGAAIGAVVFFLSKKQED